jgi:hypothetical protein
MALSREEQRVLEHLEAALAAEDPKLDEALRRGRGRGERLRFALVGAGFCAGWVLLVLGASTTVLLSVLGYALIVAASVTAIHVFVTSSVFARALARGPAEGGAAHRSEE